MVFKLRTVLCPEHLSDGMVFESSLNEKNGAFARFTPCVDSSIQRFNRPQTISPLDRSYLIHLLPLPAVMSPCYHIILNAVMTSARQNQP